MGRGRRIVGSPLLTKTAAAGLLANNGTHLANGLHGTDQVLLHSHNCFPPKIEFVVIYLKNESA